MADDKKSGGAVFWVLLIGAYGAATTIVGFVGYLKGSPEVASVAVAFFVAAFVLAWREHKSRLAATRREERAKHRRVIKDLERQLETRTHELAQLTESRAERETEIRSALGAIMATAETFERYVDEITDGTADLMTDGFRLFESLLAVLGDDEAYLPLRRAIHKAVDLANWVRPPPTPEATRPRDPLDTSGMSARVMYDLQAGRTAREAEEIANQIVEEAKGLLGR